MKNKLHVALYSFTLLLLASTTSFALCQFDGNTPDGGNIISCPAPVQSGRLTTTSMPATTAFADEINIPPGGGVNVPLVFAAINTSNGDDIVNVQGEVTSADSSAIVTLGGNDTVTVDGGNITGAGSVATINTGNDNDTVTVNSGNVIGTASGNSIDTGEGNDTITINDGFFNQDIDSSGDDDIVTINGGIFERFVETGSGNDILNLNGGIYGNSIILDNGDDTLNFNTDIELPRRVQCGQGFDTLVFAMVVPENRLDMITNQIIRSNPDFGDILINGIEYSWLGCERLVPNLQPGPNFISPVPTLSEWMLIAMAGVLGIISLMVIRKRQIA